MPGLVECHAHVAWAADRADEYQQRLAGATFQQIVDGRRRHPEHGGGHSGGLRRATARHHPQALGPLSALRRHHRGGQERLRTDAWTKRSGCWRSTGTWRWRTPWTWCPPCSPPTSCRRSTRAGRTSISRWSEKKLIPHVVKHGLAKFCDAFCEEGAYTPEQCRRVLEAGAEAGLLPKLHADQHSSHRRRRAGGRTGRRVGGPSGPHQRRRHRGARRPRGRQARAGGGAAARCHLLPGRGRPRARAPPAGRRGAGGAQHRPQPRLESHREPVAHGHHGLLAAQDDGGRGDPRHDHRGGRGPGPGRPGGQPGGGQEGRHPYPGQPARRADTLPVRHEPGVAGVQGRQAGGQAGLAIRV